jgi:multidrug resistance efflux pump
MEEKPDAVTKLEQTRLKLSMAQNNQAPVSVRALFDGIVTDVGAVKNSLVEEGRFIVTVAETEQFWIDAYITPLDARDVEQGGEARIYLPGSREPIIGTIEHEARAASNIPRTLRSRLPEMEIGIYLRISLSGDIQDIIMPGTPVRIVIPRIPKTE